MEKHRIGIIGSGVVAQALGAGFVKHGFDVMLGTRDIARLSEWKSENGAARIGNFAEAAGFGEIVILAVKGTAAENALQLAGRTNLAGKTVIDATNPIADEPPRDGVFRYFTEQNESLMERLRADCPEANFVKAFNTIGSALMVNPDFGDVRPTMFICGDSAQAKAEVGEILDLFGFDPEDMGSAIAARAIEPLAMLYCIPGVKDNDWSHAFRLMRL